MYKIVNLHDCMQLYSRNYMLSSCKTDLQKGRDLCSHTQIHLGMRLSL